MERLVFLNGSCVPESEAKVSIFNRGFSNEDAAIDKEDIKAKAGG